VPLVAQIILLLAGVCVLAALAARLRVPSPVVLVLGGLGISAVPGAPVPSLDPDVAFYLIIPPLLYAAAFNFSTVELRREARSISTLAIGLVLVTVLAVAVVAHALAGLPWAVAFVLGAIVGPTDPVSASAVMQRVGAPQRIATVLEGEALVNDGTALSVYKIALAAVGASAPSVPGTVGRFVLIAAGGIAVGLACGWISTQVRARLDEVGIEGAVAALTALGSYAAADQLRVSGVLAAVAAGLYVGYRSDEILSAGSRLANASFWAIVVFCLESLLFLLVGLQVVDVVSSLPDAALASRVAQGAAVLGVIVLLRLAWMVVVPLLLATLRLRPALLDRDHVWREQLVLGWCGTRGALSLAAALSLPATIPDHEVVVFLTYVAILGTLLLPGLTLTPLLGRLGLSQTRERREQDLELRLRLSRAALERLEELAADEELPERVVARFEDLYQARVRRYEVRERADDDEPHVDPGLTRRIRAELLDAERRELAEAERTTEASAELVRDVERDLDLEGTRLEREDGRAQVADALSDDSA
jgi:Na+/H+ antiporter